MTVGRLMVRRYLLTVSSEQTGRSTPSGRSVVAVSTALIRLRASLLEGLIAKRCDNKITQRGVTTWRPFPGRLAKAYQAELVKPIANFACAVVSPAGSSVFLKPRFDWYQIGCPAWLFLSRWRFKMPQIPSRSPQRELVACPAAVGNSSTTPTDQFA